MPEMEQQQQQPQEHLEQGQSLQGDGAASGTSNSASASTCVTTSSGMDAELLCRAVLCSSCALDLVAVKVAAGMRMRNPHCASIALEMSKEMEAVGAAAKIMPVSGRAPF